MNTLPTAMDFCGQVFLAGLWQGITLAVAVAICFRLSPRTGPAARFIVWSLAFAVTLVAPLASLQMHHRVAADSSAARLHLGSVWGYAVASLWAMLMLYRLAQLAIHICHLRRVGRNAIPINLDCETDREVIALLQRVRPPVELRLSADVDSPSVVGFRSSRLLIPKWLLASLTPADLRQVVLHELEHVRRRDGWINLIQKIGLVLFPLNPALVWMDRRLSTERELACDAGVIAQTAAPLEYASCLTRLAEHRMHYRRLALALAAWTRRSELVGRVQWILRQDAATAPRHARFAAALLGFAIVGGGIGMTWAPRLVSFTDAARTTTAQALPALRSGIAPTAIPVAYRQIRQPRETLVNAVMPMDDRRRVEPAAGTVALQPVKSRLGHAPIVKTKRRPRLLTASINTSPKRAADTPYRPSVMRTIYVVSEFPPTYAAVPFADGWLIVQL